MQKRKNTKTTSGKKIGRPRTLTNAQRKAKDAAHAERFTEWSRERRKDPKYREEMKRRAKERKEQLETDARLGRVARLWMGQFLDIINIFAIACNVYGKGLPTSKGAK